jgi:hypothetical protein
MIVVTFVPSYKVDREYIQTLFTADCITCAIRLLSDYLNITPISDLLLYVKSNDHDSIQYQIPSFNPKEKLGIHMTHNEGSIYINRIKTIYELDKLRKDFIDLFE